MTGEEAGDGRGGEGGGELDQHVGDAG